MESIESSVGNAGGQQQQQQSSKRFTLPLFSDIDADRSSSGDCDCCPCGHHIETDYSFKFLSSNRGDKFTRNVVSDRHEVNKPIENILKDDIRALTNIALNDLEDLSKQRRNNASLERSSAQRLVRKKKMKRSLEKEECMINNKTTSTTHSLFERTTSVPVRLDKLSPYLSKKIEEGSLRDTLLREFSATRRSNGVCSSKPVHHSIPPIEIGLIIGGDKEVHELKRSPPLLITESIRSSTVEQMSPPNKREFGMYHQAEPCQPPPLPTTTTDTIRTYIEQIENVYKEKIKVLRKHIEREDNDADSCTKKKEQRHVAISHRPTQTSRSFNTDTILSGRDVALQCYRAPECRDACIQFQQPAKQLTQKSVQTASSRSLPAYVQCELLKVRPMALEACIDTLDLIKTQDAGTEAKSIAELKNAAGQTERQTNTRCTGDACTDTVTVLHSSTNTIAKVLVDASVCWEANDDDDDDDSKSNKKLVDRASSPIGVLIEETIIEEEEHVVEEEIEEEYSRCEFEEEEQEQQMISTLQYSKPRGILKNTTETTSTSTVGLEENGTASSFQLICSSAQNAQQIDSAKRSVEVSTDLGEDSIQNTLYFACNVLNKHFFEPGLSDRSEVEKASRIIQDEWFKALSDPDYVFRLLSIFKNFSNFLLERVINMTDSNLNSALHHTLSKGSWTTVKLLIDMGVCDVNLQNARGYTAAMLCAAINLNVSNDEQVQTYRKVFTESNVNIRTEESGYTALMLACERGNVECTRLLLSAGAHINIQDNCKGETALMKAVDGAHLNTVQLLLEDGGVDCCDLNISDNNGFTVFTKAANLDNKDILNLLYRKRQSTFHTQSTLSHQTVEYGNSRWIPRAKHQAADLW